MRTPTILCRTCALYRLETFRVGKRWLEDRRCDAAMRFAGMRTEYVYYTREPGSDDERPNGEGAIVRVAEQHQDWFARNMVAILVEERLALAITNTAAMMYGSLNFVG